MGKMNSILTILFVCAIFPSYVSQAARHPSKDREVLIALEQEWLHASDAVTLDRILASDFVHVVPVDHFLTKQEHIDWTVKHPEAKERHTRFDKVQVRLYGDVGIVNGSVIASDPNGKELDRTMFTDVFVYRDGRWQAVNGQENAVRAASGEKR